MIHNRMRLTEYRKAKNRCKKNKLGVFPLVDRQGLYSIYLFHRKIRVLQHLADHILKIPRHYIHRKPKFLYIKLIEEKAEKWVEYMKENDWKKL